MKNISRFFIIIITLFTIPLAVFNVSANNNMVIKDTKITELTPDITNMLYDYSQLMSSGKTIKGSYYSPQMMALANERNVYYNELFEKGLHANLLTINSKYITEKSVEVILIGSESHYKIDEFITLYGQPIITQPDKFPLIMAAKWAVTKANNARVKNELIDYISLMTDGVNKSAHDGITTSFIVHHEIVISKGDMTIIRDTFNDKDIDKPEGFDNVIWNNGVPIRQKPDLTKMPDYILNNIAIDILGQLLLQGYSNNLSGISPNSTGWIYSHGAASSYASYYTSRASVYTCLPDILQDKYWYSHNYDYITNYSLCNDCANYVSQALFRGGFTTGGVWYASYSSFAWIRTTNLRDYLMGQGAMTGNTNNINALTIGDIAFTTGDGHVVMVTGVNPYLYSGHTNDRQNQIWDSTITDYRHIYTNQP